jgi:hypothetical protein
LLSGRQDDVDHVTVGVDSQMHFGKDVLGKNKPGFPLFLWFIDATS